MFSSVLEVFLGMLFMSLYCLVVSLLVGTSYNKLPSSARVVAFVEVIVDEQLLPSQRINTCRSCMSLLLSL
jgi:hypothetical protein